MLGISSAGRLPAIGRTEMLKLVKVENNICNTRDCTLNPSIAEISAERPGHYSRVRVLGTVILAGKWGPNEVTDLMMIIEVTVESGTVSEVNWKDRPVWLK